MTYFNELPFIEYPSIFENSSSNDDYTLVRNIFRRAILRGDVANSVTAFTYYQVKDNERPDQIAEKVYGDPELDWVILITNNIINYPGEWTMNNDTLYDYIIDKYGSDDELENIKYFETNEVRDDYDRLVQPEGLQVQKDLYQEFKTIKDKENPLFYDLEFYPVPSKYYPSTVTINLGQYLEVWERTNLEDGQPYVGKQYQVDEINIRKPLNTTVYDFPYPSYTKLDYSFLKVYTRNSESFNIFIPNSLEGWPYTWNGETLIYYRDSTVEKLPLFSNVGFPVDITDDYRLYVTAYHEEVGLFSYTDGTVISGQENKTYTIVNPDTNLDGKQAIFEIKRNKKAEIISIKTIDGGRDYVEGEILTIKGSLIGGEDIIDDIRITVDSINRKPQFRFLSIGPTLNEPFPGLKVTTFNETGMSYLDTGYNKVDIFDNENKVSNYEYELKINESNRNILILKPEYLGAFIGNLRNIMSYDESSETITKRIKRIKNIEIRN